MKNIKITKFEPMFLTGKFGDKKYYGYGNKKIIGLTKIYSNTKQFAYGESLAGTYDPDIFSKNLEILSLKFKNKNLIDALKLCTQLQKNKFYYYQGILKNVLSSIEIAILNLISKINNNSFASTVNKIYFKNKLIEKNYVNIYGSAGSILSSEKDLIKDIKNAKKLGISKIKIRLKTTNFKNKIKILEKNTKKFAIDLIANTYEKNKNIKNLKKFLSSLKSKKLLWIEEAINVNDMYLFSKIRKKYKLPYSYGENFNSFYDYVNLIKLYKFKFINIDISHCTITDLCNLINYLIKHNLKNKIIFHCWGSVINLHTSLELASIMSKYVYMVEFPITNFTLNNKFVKSSKIKNSKFFFSTSRNMIKDIYHDFSKKRKKSSKFVFKFE